MYQTLPWISVCKCVCFSVCETLKLLSDFLQNKNSGPSTSQGWRIAGFKDMYEWDIGNAQNQAQGRTSRTKNKENK